MVVAPALLVGMFMIAMAAEAVWSWRRRNGFFNLKESLSNLSIMVVGAVLRPAVVAWSLLVLSLFEPLQVTHLPDGGWALLLTFVVVDFAFYWYHRLSHRIAVLWALHSTHHSSRWMNLTTAVRLNWIARFVAPLFFAPLVILGFSPLYVALSLALGLVLQFLLHTQSIGSLGRFEGKLLNTPSAHRVHHGTNAQYVNKNFGGVFIIWDRFFGTYEPECEPVRFGVATGFVGHNPLRIQFAPLMAYIRER